MIHFSWLKKDLYKVLLDPSTKFVWVFFLVSYLILIKNIPKVIILLFFLLIYIK